MWVRHIYKYLFINLFIKQYSQFLNRPFRSPYDQHFRHKCGTYSKGILKLCFGGNLRSKIINYFIDRKIIKFEALHQGKRNGWNQNSWDRRIRI